MTQTSMTITKALADDRWPAYEVEAANKTRKLRVSASAWWSSRSRDRSPRHGRRRRREGSGRQAGGSWEDWEIKLRAEQQTKGYHADLAIGNGEGEEEDDVDLSSGMSEGGFEDIGDNLERPDHGH